MVGKLLDNQMLPFVFPDTVIAPFREADKPKATGPIATHQPRNMKITAVVVLRLLGAFGIYKAAQTLKANEFRTATAFGGVLSAPAAGIYGSFKLLQSGVIHIKKGIVDRSFGKVAFGSASWVAGCILAQLSQTVSYKGYRWGLVELFNHRIIGDDLEYRGWKGY